FTKGVVLGTVLSVIGVLLAFRFQNFSRAVFIIDGLILLFLIVASRMAFRLIRELLPTPHQHDGRRVMIFGAGDGGEMVLREIRNNPTLHYQVVGFIDDDPMKVDKMINGLRVFDANGSMRTVCREKDVQEILISTGKISGETLRRVREMCRESDILLKRAAMRIEPMEFE
ncbi:MAG: nucleoside-diphosphate sugar epimerase/dehydratase, partial [Pyrinomonadaceae bacterium]